MQRTIRLTVLWVATGVVLIAGVGAAAEQAQPGKSQSKHVMVDPATVAWGPGPPALPAGAQAAVLDGDPGKRGMFTLRLKLPDAYVVPPHSHPIDEHVTVISGTLTVGMGDKADQASMQAMPAGAYVKMPARSNHYVRAKGETIIQVMAMGPFEVKYVNPDDDPRKKTAPSK